MKTILLKPFTLLPALALLLAACAQVPPDTSRAAIADATRAQLSSNLHLAAEGWPDALWWTRYRDEQLDGLIATALRDNPGLAVASARVAAAQAALGVSASAGGFGASLAAGLNRQRYSGNGLFPEPIGGHYFNDASIAVKAGYDFDLWGKHRAEVAASAGERNARQAEQALAERNLAAAVAQGYFHWQLLGARIDATSALADLQQQLVEERRQRVTRGLATIDEQRIAERDLGVLREQALALGAQAAREREALRALVGDSSGAAPALQRRAVTAGAAVLPARLGLELLARRPDLQASRWRIESMLGSVAARQAAFYPDINLAAAFGLDAVSLGRLLRPDSRTLLAGSAIELPLFDSRRLAASLGEARAERDSAIADYNAAVARAVGEVAQEGATLQGLQAEIAAHARTRAASAELVASSTRRMQAGLGERASVLLARQSLLRQDDIALQQQDAALQTEVALLRALGGGYQAPAQASTAALN